MVRVRGIPQGLKGMIVYINTDEPEGEKPHVHIARGGRKRRGDLKWLLRERDFDRKTTRGFTKVQLNKLRAYFALYHEECVQEWRRIHGAKGRPRHA